MRVFSSNTLLLILLTFFLCSCSASKKRIHKVRKVKFIKTEYSKIIGWHYDNHLSSLKTFKNSCRVILKIKDNKPISRLTKLGGNAKHWKSICYQLQNTNIQTNQQAKEFFEASFFPYIVLNNNSTSGKFTGYYEIEINGSLKKNRLYEYPVYMSPNNLLNHQKNHYLSHSSINSGSLKGKDLEICWVDNYARLYFMHIQGSGRIRLNNGQLLRLGYAGQNGFEYKSIGPYFKQYNAKGINSVLDMMEWLHKNPKKSRKIVEKNQSYVFFKKIDGYAPIGGQGIPLTPERSIALDHGIYPYGTPVWVDTILPKTKNHINRKYRRLFIMQDTGGAIKGGIRGDIFFGHGKKSEELACYMNNKGKQYVLFPKNTKIQTYFSTM